MPYREVAGIIDPHGGLRVVVGEGRSILANCCRNEMLFVLPDRVLTDADDKVPWEKIPFVIDSVKRYVAEWIRTRNDPDSINHIGLVRYRARVEERRELALAREVGGSLHIAGLLS